MSKLCSRCLGYCKLAHVHDGLEHKIAADDLEAFTDADTEIDIGIKGVRPFAVAARAMDVQEWQAYFLFLCFPCL